MTKKMIKIFDTTLRDGEQSPGCSMNIQEKIKVAKQLEKLNVDVIEAGFAIASPGDFESVKKIAETVQHCKVASLARALPKDIDYAAEAIKNAKYPRIHTFIATSPIHMKHKLQMKPEKVIEQAESMVKYAKKYCADVEFSAEDATRSNLEFLYEIFTKVIEAGATVINIPDTVGYTVPNEFYNFIKSIKENVPNIDQVEISVHCHNDLGLAVSNTLAAARAGATQFECTINGIGERAGNAALEELAMAINTRKDFLNLSSNINTTEIIRASKLLSNITGVQVQPNKAIVGANAFAHESGIHQHGMLQENSTYEIMTPESVGLTTNKMVLGKHSGKHALRQRLESLGYKLNEDDINKAFKKFKELADKKKVIYNRDIEAIVSNSIIEFPKTYQLEKFIINSGNSITATSSITLISEKEKFEEVSAGDGPVDASFKAIDKIIGKEFTLEDYHLNAVTEGKDAQGEATISIQKNNEIYRGRGLSTDVIEASINAYLDAINKMIYFEDLKN